MRLQAFAVALLLAPSYLAGQSASVSGFVPAPDYYGAGSWREPVADEASLPACTGTEENNLRYAIVEGSVYYCPVGGGSWVPIGGSGGSGDITDVGDCATGACFQAEAAREAFIAPSAGGVAGFRLLTEADISDLGDYVTDPQNVVSVCPAGCDYTDVSDAIDFVTAELPGSTNRWEIWLYDGDYSEGFVTVPQYTAIRGMGAVGVFPAEHGPKIVFDDSATSGDWITMSAGSSIRGVRLWATSIVDATAEFAVLRMSGTNAVITDSVVVTFWTDTTAIVSAIRTSGTGGNYIQNVAIEAVSVGATVGSAPLRILSRATFAQDNRFINNSTSPCVFGNNANAKLNDFGGNIYSCTSAHDFATVGGAYAILGGATDTTAGEIVLAGDLAGTYDSPQVTDDSHDHTTTTISGLVEADITDLSHFSPTAGISTDHGAGAITALTDLGDICAGDEILERNTLDTAWACIATPSGGGASPGGATGDIQKNDGAGGLAASVLNDDGTNATLSGTGALILPSAVYPNIYSPGDPDSGMWVADTPAVGWRLNGVNALWASTAGVKYEMTLFGNGGGAPSMINGTMSLTTPGYARVGDTNTGLGLGGSDNGCLIAGGLSASCFSDTLTPVSGAVNAMRTSADTQLHVSCQSGQTDNCLEVDADGDGTLTDGGMIIDKSGKMTIYNILRIEPMATAPSTCTIGDVYTDTSGAICHCSATNTWEALGATGSCA